MEGVVPMVGLLVVVVRRFFVRVSCLKSLFAGPALFPSVSPPPSSPSPPSIFFPIVFSTNKPKTKKMGGNN